jgi:oxazoline/thiazoline dehydrogenase
VPGAACEAVLVDEQASAWVAECVRPQALRPDADEPRGAFLGLLERAGLLDVAGFDEPEGMRTWEFHDRLFHYAGRGYRDGVARGPTHRFGNGHVAPGPVRAPYDGRVRELPGPRAATRGRPLRELMESRRSQRDMSGAPVTVEELSELLHRTARTVAIEQPDGIIRRPYPSAGSLHELELYLAVGACRGLEAGLYHYRGDEHTLISLGATGPSEAMLADCARAWQQPGHPPQVLVVIASRLPRLASKYEGYAYRLSLMNAGVLIANLQLVLTDMGLAGAAAGSGDPDLFAAATGADSWEETSIAEFGFGRARN